MAGDLIYYWIPSPDPERGRAFYSGLFGWTLEPREQGDGYAITSTSLYAGIVGGRPGTRPFLYFLVDDVSDTCSGVVPSRSAMRPRTLVRRASISSKYVIPARPSSTSRRACSAIASAVARASGPNVPAFRYARRSSTGKSARASECVK